MNKLSVKKLGFGTMRLPLTNPDDPKSVDHRQFCQMVDQFLARGFTYFDTAYPYHDECSEEAVRKALVERHPRDSFLLCDKMPVFRVKEAEDYPRFFAEQFRRCGVDYFDVYLLHNLGRDRYETVQRTDGFGFVSRMKEEGKVRRMGFSFHDDAETLERILTDHPEVDLVQLQINYLDWESAVAQSGKCYEVAQRHGKQVIVMEPVKGGQLANLPVEAAERFRAFYGEGPSQASLAVRYAASLEGVAVVLSGMSDLAQLEDNTGYMGDFTPLTHQETALAGELAAILKRAIKVPCTGCRYCMEVCPMNIAIPDYFGLLNLHAVTGKKTNMYYQRYKMNHGLASQCLECGLCQGNCPQHIEIRDFLKEFAALYEEG